MPRDRVAISSTRRPSARASITANSTTTNANSEPASSTQSTPHAHGAHRGPRLAAARAEGLRRIRALYARHSLGAFYSVEIGIACGISRTRAYDLLCQLEHLGELESKHAPVAMSGPGRRYFRRPVSQPPTQH